jgi:hypothetical protein
MVINKSVKKGRRFTMAKVLGIWLWLSVVLAVTGALLLYPIGAIYLNIIFIAVKAGMLCGIFLLLFPKKKYGFYIWAGFSMGAVIMTIIKWSLAGSASFLFILSIIADILMPAVAYALIRKQFQK